MEEHPIVNNQSICKFIRGDYDTIGYQISTIVFLTAPYDLPRQVMGAYHRCIDRQDFRPMTIHLY